MARYKHSNLSDDGVEDDDLMAIASEQPHPGDESFLSRGSFGAASSPDRGNQANANSPWLFDDIVPFAEFSSVRVHDEPLPETVPIPTQMQNLHLEHAVNATERSRVDVSETCSTALRSSPCNPDYNSQIWEFDAESDCSRDAAAPSTSTENKKESTSKTKAANKKPQPQEQVREGKTYNTRPRRKIVYADDGNSSEDDDDPEEQYIPSAQNATGERTRQSEKQNCPKISSTQKSAKDANPKNIQSPCEDSNDAQDSASTREKKRKQRPKNPLPFNKQTQVILSRQPATPPLSEKRPKKRTTRWVSAPIYVASESEAEDSIVVASDILSEIEDCPELSESEEQLELRPDRPNEGSNVERRVSASPAPPVDEVPEANHGEELESNNRRTDHLNNNPSAGFHQIPQVQPVEEQRASTVADSTESTNITSPCVSEHSKISPEIRAPAELPKTQPLTVPSSARVDETPSSVFTALQAQQEYFGGLGILSSRHASKQDEDVNRRFQDVHGRIRMHLESKEKDVDVVVATYRKNGAGCVNRIQARFSKERQELSRKLQDDGDVFIRFLGAAKKVLRDGGKERQKVLKEMERNAQKRRQTSSVEVSRLTDFAKQLQLEVL